MSTSRARKIIESLDRLGVALEATPAGRLRYTPRSKVDKEMRGELLRHKPELLRILSTVGKSYIPSPSSPPSPSSQTPDINGETSGDGYGDGISDDAPQPPPPRPAFIRQAEEKASALGLVARWSRHFGYISLYDSTSGEWHDVQTKDAPSWAKWEAHKRKELWRSGDSHAYDLTALDMSEIWEDEHPADPFGDKTDAIDERGIVYEDYLQKEESSRIR